MRIIVLYNFESLPKNRDLDCEHGKRGENDWARTVWETYKTYNL